MKSLLISNMIKCVVKRKSQIYRKRYILRLSNIIYTNSKLYTQHNCIIHYYINIINNAILLISL